jgi:hypothetical protein
MSLRDFSDALKLQAVSRWDTVIAAQQWPPVTSRIHLGAIAGALYQYGYSDAQLLDILDRVVRAWVDNTAPPEELATCPHIGDNEVLELYNRAVDRIPFPDHGGQMDLGVQYGQHLAMGVGIPRAFHAAGAWLERWWPGAGNPWELPVSPLLPLRVDSDGQRWFRTDAGREPLVEVSAFSLFALIQHGRAQEARDYIRAFTARASGLRLQMRVILSLGGDYWTNTAERLSGRRLDCGPQLAGAEDALRTLMAMAHEEGVRLRCALFGSPEPFGGVWYPDRRDVWQGSVRATSRAYAHQMARVMAGDSAVMLEIANEPYQIGMRHSIDWIIELGKELRPLIGSMVMNGAPTDGPGSDHPNPMAVAPPFDFSASHLYRLMGVDGMEWVKRSGDGYDIDHALQKHKMPYMSGEPVNFGEPRRDGHTGDVEPRLSVALCYGAVSRVRQYNANFHTDCGLWCTLPGPATIASFDAFVQGVESIPQMVGGLWRGHHPASYWKGGTALFPAHDDEQTVMAHVTAGRGPWRIYGANRFSVSIAEPLGWDYTKALKPGMRVRRVAYHAGPRVACGVYVEE